MMSDQESNVHSGIGWISSGEKFEFRQGLEGESAGEKYSPTPFLSQGTFHCKYTHPTSSHCNACFPHLFLGVNNNLYQTFVFSCVLSYHHKTKYKGLIKCIIYSEKQMRKACIAVTTCWERV